MKKFVSMLLALVMVFALCACGSKTEDGDKAESIKVGFICLHDENSTYDKNFIDAAKAACKNAGLSEDQYIIKTNIPEGQECYNAAAELVDAGCNVVFADSFGHEDFMIQAAKDFPKVQFCHATGTKAHTEKLSNYHNAFASIYEGRYLAGVAAGMKLNEMIEAGKFTTDKQVHHTHEGSIGNLCTEEIALQMQAAVDQFHFEQIEQAEEALLRTGE